MSYSIKESAIRLAQQDRNLSFEEFSKENGFPISVFESYKSNTTNPLLKSPDAIGRMLARQEELKEQLAEMQREHKKYLIAKYRKLMKKEMVEYGIRTARAMLWSAVSHERKKLDYQIYKAKKKYGVEASRQLIRKAEQQTDSLYTEGKFKVWDIAADTRKMAETNSIPTIINTVVPQVKALVRDGKEEFHDILEKLENGKPQT